MVPGDWRKQGAIVHRRLQSRIVGPGGKPWRVGDVAPRKPQAGAITPLPGGSIAIACLGIDTVKDGARACRSRRAEEIGE
jgi:hypothetical protein